MNPISSLHVVLEENNAPQPLKYISAFFCQTVNCLKLGKLVTSFCHSSCHWNSLFFTEKIHLPKYFNVIPEVITVALYTGMIE